VRARAIDGRVGPKINLSAARKQSEDKKLKRAAALSSLLTPWATASLKT
jgi:hypothetical protein